MFSFTVWSTNVFVILSNFSVYSIIYIVASFTQKQMFIIVHVLLKKCYCLREKNTRPKIDGEIITYSTYHCLLSKVPERVHYFSLFLHLPFFPFLFFSFEKRPDMFCLSGQGILFDIVNNSLLFRGYCYRLLVSLLRNANGLAASAFHSLLNGVLLTE